MYDWPELRPQTDAIWDVFHKHFDTAGFESPSGLSRSECESDGWLDPSLFFSQTCGYPFITRLEGRVQLVATPHFDVEGWKGPLYSSAIIVRRDSGLGTLDDIRSAAFAYNSNDSLSGFRCLSPLIGNPDHWFDRRIKSGGHRNSALMVSNGAADVAAIDALCWHFFRRIEPESASKLHVVQWTPPLPGLPYITNLTRTEGDLGRMREALNGAITEIENSGLTPDIPLVGLSPLDVAAYQSIKSL